MTPTLKAQVLEHKSELLELLARVQFVVAHSMGGGAGGATIADVVVAAIGTRALRSSQSASSKQKARCDSGRVGDGNLATVKAQTEVSGMAEHDEQVSVPPITPPRLRLEWRSPAELAENPRNWRTHPQTQIEALTAVISEVGWAGACLYNAVTGRLIDGHVRRKLALDQGAEKIPVLIGHWTAEQEAKILATLDPISALAEADTEKLDALLREVQTDNDALSAMLAALASDNGLGQDPEPASPAGADEIFGQFQILVECDDETTQAALLEKLTSEGYKCRSLIS
jgi:hypothetical protein